MQILKIGSQNTGVRQISYNGLVLPDGRPEQSALEPIG